MDTKEKNTGEYYSIDISHVFKTLWKRIWVVIVCGMLSAVMGFLIAAFAITPMYSSSIMLYVNNSSFSLGATSFSISSSEITAAQSLVKTYIVMLKNRTTLEAVIEKSGLDYDYEQLYKMIDAASVNGTEVMGVTVTADNPYEAEKLANTIAEILPKKISEIIEGSSMEVVDSAVPNLQKISPSITKYTAVGLILGILVSVIAIVVFAMLDDTIHDEAYIIKTYNCPVLAKIPDLASTPSQRYGYYYQKRPDKKGTDVKEGSNNG